MKEDNKIRILFLCTANACRSQMAQGWTNHLKSDTIDAYSAGTRPGRVSLRAIEVMKEAGVDISHHYSKHIDDISMIDFDYVITLCDSANESCPVFPKNSTHIHHSFPDPAAAIGTIPQVMNEFRKVRDMIKEYVLTLPQSLE